MHSCTVQYISKDIFNNINVISTNVFINVLYNYGYESYI